VKLTASIYVAFDICGYGIPKKSRRPQISEHRNWIAKKWSIVCVRDRFKNDDWFVELQIRLCRNLIADALSCVNALTI
jgi:hypothetical protein